MPFALPMDECDPVTGICSLNFGRASYVTPAGAAWQVVNAIDLFASQLIGNRVPNQFVPDTESGGVVVDVPVVYGTDPSDKVFTALPVSPLTVTTGPQNGPQTVGGLAVPIQQQPAVAAQSGMSNQTLLLIGLGLVAVFMFSGKK